ncbi:MAG: hypothetical protein WAJ87_09605 [Bryobacteraceae bacterium]
MTRQSSFALVAAVITTTLAGAQSSEAQPLRIAIAGLNHGHVSGFLRSAQSRATDVVIVAVWDPDAELLAKYARSDHFADDQLYGDLNKMLDTAKPEAVATFTDKRHDLLRRHCGGTAQSPWHSARANRGAGLPRNIAHDIRVA